jgi:hypothetical protein
MGSLCPRISLGLWSAWMLVPPLLNERANRPPTQTACSFLMLVQVIKVAFAEGRRDQTNGLRFIRRRRLRPRKGSAVASRPETAKYERLSCVVIAVAWSSCLKERTCSKSQYRRDLLGSWQIGSASTRNQNHSGPGGKLPTSDDDAANANISRQARSAHLWGGSAYHCRRGRGARTLSTDQGGMSERGLHSGCRPRGHWATDPLHHAHHAGAGSAADCAKAVAESRSANRG